MYTLLRGLLAPDLPKEKGFDELEKALTDHYEPKPLVIAERFNFYKRGQAAGESLADYQAELRRLARTCEFGSFLNDALRDQFVVRMRSESIQKRLLTEAKLTLARALEIGLGMEAAAVKAKEYKEAPPAVMQVQALRRRSCYRCGRNNHDAKDCKFREATCHNCGKVGHIAPACRSPKKAQQKNQISPGQHKPRAKFVEVEQEPSSDSPIEDLALFTIGAHSSKLIEVAVRINDKPLTMELDTGADVSIVSEKTYRALLPGTELHPLSVPLRTYTGERMKVLGQVSVTVKYEQVVATGPLSLWLLETALLCSDATA